MADPIIALRSLLLATGEMEESVRFYRDTVGLALLMRDGDRYAELDAGGLKLALAAPSDHPLPATPVPTFKAADVEAAVQSLMAGGASILVGPRPGAHEIRAVLRDPAGNAFVVYSSRS